LRRLVVPAAAVLAVGLWMARDGRLADPGPARPTPAPATLVSQPVPAPSVPPLRRDPFRFASDESGVSPDLPAGEWAPRAPAAPAPTPAPSIRLSGFVRRGGQIRAVLSVPGGPLILGAGEEAEGYRVLEIDEEAGVRVRLPDGQEIKLELLSP